MKNSLTYLYIKQHSITGMLYFGKTTKKDPIGYLGSGTYWVSHVKKHGIEHVVTLWYESFIDQSACTKFALEFSEKLNIVKSDNWANLKPENGLDGILTGTKFSAEHRANMSKPLTAKHRANIAASQLGKSRGKGRKIGPSTAEHRANISLANKGKVSWNKKLWTLQDPTGQIKIIQGLKAFCKEEKLGLSKLLETKITKQLVEIGLSTGWMILNSKNIFKGELHEAE